MRGRAFDKAFAIANPCS